MEPPYPSEPQDSPTSFAEDQRASEQSPSVPTGLGEDDKTATDFAELEAEEIPVPNF